MTELQRDTEEKMKEMSNDELIYDIGRGHARSLKAAKEILSRKEFGTKGENLRKILNIRSIPPDKAEEETKIKNEAAIIIEQGFLDRRNLLTILRQIKFQKILKRAIRKYLAENKNVPNYILEEMIRSIKSLSSKEVLATKVLDQNPGPDDLLVIVEELEDLERFPEGSPLQRKALKKLLEMGISREDFVWLTGSVKSVTEITWKDVKKDLIETLFTEDIYEISRYTDSPKVKEETLNKMWLKKEGLTTEQLEYVKGNAELITIEDPGKIKEWINNRLLHLVLDFEEAMSLEKEMKSSSLRLKMAEKALELVKEKIEEKEAEKKEFPYRYLLNGREENQLKSLKEKAKELKAEILNLQEQITESIKGEEMKVNTTSQT